MKTETKKQDSHFSEAITLVVPVITALSLGIAAFTFAPAMMLLA